MGTIDKFGKYVGELSEEKPERARKLLKTGWQIQNAKLKYLTDKRLLPAERYLEQFMMERMILPLKEPEKTVAVSIFTPCELIFEAGLSPYSVEGFSSYLSGTRAEQEFLQQAEEIGLSNTLCSYHKGVIGAAHRKLLPKPKCIIYTNLTCDANLLTFQYLADFYHIPMFFIDVPGTISEDSVNYVAEQLKEMKLFLEKVTGNVIAEERLIERVKRGQNARENYERFQRKRAEHYIPTSFVTPLYNAISNNVFSGTKEQEHYTQMLLKEVESAEEKKGLHIYWMHTLPFWSEAMKEKFSFQERVQSVGCDLAQVYQGKTCPEKPYEAMARRLVYHSMNGSGMRRIENGIRCAKEAGADGVIWFNHWGCKHTLGIARLAKRKFEEAGLPMLILDNDGCDRSQGGEGQMATRVEAFLEMLEARKNE